MTRLLLVFLVVGLTGCATLKSDRAPGCSGPRRPANPYGTVLAPEVAAPAAAGGQCMGALQ